MLALFDANVPTHFTSDERGWLEDSLDDLEGPAFIVTVDTSPKVAPFFLSQGFETAGVWPQGHRTCGEMHLLRFDLATTTAGALKQRSAAAFQAAQARCGAFGRSLPAGTAAG